MRQALAAAQTHLDKLQERHATLVERLDLTDRMRHRARLDALRAEAEQDRALRELERARLLTIDAHLPHADESIRFILARLMSDATCLVCGTEDVAARRQSLEQALEARHCVICDSLIEMSMPADVTEITDARLQTLKAAYDAGVRHIQLVHFVRNSIGDFQTEAPKHGGLTDFGRKVVEECNRLGILVDLAHCTRAAVDHALAVAKVPLVWSHSSVARGASAGKARSMWQMRQLDMDQAKQIAAKGGVVGLWALRSDVGATVESYGDRIIEMAGWLGDDHVAFGTDMNSLGNAPVSSYGDLRRVVRHLERKLSAERVRKIAIGNYARVLRQAMEAAKA